MQYAPLPSLKDITQATNVDLFLDFNWEQRQLSTRLRSLLCLTMGLKSWRIYECWWLPWFLISKKKLEKTQYSFWLFLEKYVRYIFCFICPAFLPVHIIINYATYHSTPSCLHSDNCCFSTTSPLPANMADKNCQCRDAPYDKECPKYIVDVSWAVDS